MLPSEWLKPLGATVQWASRRQARLRRPSWTTHARTFRVQRLLHDDLHPLHVVPVPEAVQGLAVLGPEGQDLSHSLSGRR